MRQIRHAAFRVVEFILSAVALVLWVMLVYVFRAVHRVARAENESWLIYEHISDGGTKKIVSYATWSFGKTTISDEIER